MLPLFGRARKSHQFFYPSGMARIFPMFPSIPVPLRCARTRAAMHTAPPVRHRPRMTWIPSPSLRPASLVIGHRWNSCDFSHPTDYPGAPRYTFSTARRARCFEDRFCRAVRQSRREAGQPRHGHRDRRMTSIVRWWRLSELSHVAASCECRSSAAGDRRS
jgi:hypothetical protein